MKFYRLGLEILGWKGQNTEKFLWIHDVCYVLVSSQKRKCCF